MNFRKTDEENLVKEFLRGNRNSIEKLIEIYQRPLYFLCLRIVENHEDAQELVQKTFINAMENLINLQNHAAFKPWIYKIAINLCHNLLRKRNSYTRMLNALPKKNDVINFSDPLEKEEEKKIIQNSFQILSEKQKYTIFLRVYHDLSYKEIGEILGCKETTARSHFHLGIKKLAKWLEHHFS